MRRRPTTRPNMRPQKAPYGERADMGKGEVQLQGPRKLKAPGVLECLQVHLSELPLMPRLCQGRQSGALGRTQAPESDTRGFGPWIHFRKIEAMTQPHWPGILLRAMIRGFSKCYV